MIVYSIFEICRAPLLFLGDPVMQTVESDQVIRGSFVSWKCLYIPMFFFLYSVYGLLIGFSPATKCRV